MLKAKIRPSRINKSLLRELEKDDDLRPVYGKVNTQLYKKLKKHLAEVDMQLCEWLKEKIEEI